MSPLKSFFNQICQPLLLALGITPPLFPDSEPFSQVEFPHAEFPLTVQDWRDLLSYLYLAHPHTQDGGGYKVLSVERYRLGSHQILVARVEVGEERIKLLRFERDGKGVVDVGEDAIRPSVNLLDEEPVEETTSSRLSPSPVAGPSSSILGQEATEPVEAVEFPNDDTPHPSTSIYAHAHSTGSLNKVKNLDTVQTTFPRALRGYEMMNSVILPVGFYLHHLALLVAEVHEYDESKRGHAIGHCAVFAERVMSVLSEDVGVAVSDSRGGEGSKGKEAKNGEEGSLLLTSDGEAEVVREIAVNYRRSKEGLEAKRDVPKTSEDEASTALLKKDDIGLEFRENAVENV